MSRFFCISDIHGNYLAFEDVLHQSKFTLGQDVLYVLGDIIDWGAQSIDLLRLIMGWQKKYPDKIFVSIGNHELMFLSSLINEYSKIIWMYNGGYDTLSQFHDLTKLTQEEIIDWLINDCKGYFTYNNYYLTHSVPMPNDKDFVISNSLVKLHPDSNPNLVYSVWERVDLNKQNVSGNKQILISGHTPVQDYPNNPKNEVYFALSQNYIGIDCGAKMLNCGTNYKLALLEIPTYNVWYSQKCI